MAKRRAGGPARPQPEFSEAPLFAAKDALAATAHHFDKAEKDDAPHYAGHRERLRERFK